MVDVNWLIKLGNVNIKKRTNNNNNNNNNNSNNNNNNNNNNNVWSVLPFISLTFVTSA